MKNVKLITEHFEKLSNTSGEFSIPKMWNLKKKIFPRNSDVPMAMKDHKGNLISGKEGPKQLYKDTYIERLSEKPINEGKHEAKKGRIIPKKAGNIITG